MRKKWREARDRLSEAEYRVGFHYYRVRWYPGAIPTASAKCSRRTRNSPGATACTSIWRNASPEPIRNAEAIPSFERLLDEFSAERARRGRTKKRLEELNGCNSAGGPSGPPVRESDR